jgi:5'(3')-deoxyribonucleotidase
MSHQVIFLDLDGVLVDFIGAALRLHSREDFFETPSNRGLWDIEELVAGSKRKFWAPLDGPKFWSSLEKLPESDQIVHWCAEKVGEENVAILTTPSSSPYCIPGKQQWLRKYYPQFSSRTIFTGAKEFLAAPGKFLVDDRDLNVEKFNKAGGTGILVPRLWNAGHPLYSNVMETLNGQWEAYARRTN